MFTRTAVLIFMACVALNGPVTHAKVSPAPELQQQYGDQELQRLIYESVDRKWCGPESGRVESGETGITFDALFEHSYAERTCPLPAPAPDPFENVAYIL